MVYPYLYSRSVAKIIHRPRTYMRNSYVVSYLCFFFSRSSAVTADCQVIFIVVRSCYTLISIHHFLVLYSGERHSGWRIFKYIPASLAGYILFGGRQTDGNLSHRVLNNKLVTHIKLKIPQTEQYEQDTIIINY